MPDAFLFSDDAKADIVELFPGLDERERVAKDSPLEVDWGKNERDRFCHHRHTRLDMQARRVYCRDCGHEVPAFDVLFNLCQRMDTYLAIWERAQEGARRVEKQLAGLERREKNTKSRIRRAKKRAGPTVLETAAHVVDATWRATMPSRDPDADLERIAKWLRDRVETAEDDYPDGAIQTILHKIEAIAIKARPAPEAEVIEGPGVRAVQ